MPRYLKATLQNKTEQNFSPDFYGRQKKRGVIFYESQCSKKIIRAQEREYF